MNRVSKILLSVLVFFTVIILVIMGIAKMKGVNISETSKVAKYQYQMFIGKDTKKEGQYKINNVEDKKEKLKPFVIQEEFKPVFEDTALDKYIINIDSIKDGIYYLPTSSIFEISEIDSLFMERIDSMSKEELSHVFVFSRADIDSLVLFADIYYSLHKKEFGIEIPIAFKVVEGKIVKETPLVFDVGSDRDYFKKW